jgi:hypothetical protein
MSESKVELVEAKGFTINLPSTGAPVALNTDGDEIVILMRLTLRPRYNVMNINLDVSASRDGAAVSRLDENAPTDISRYWRAPPG